MAKKQLRIALIGYQFMGKAHSNAYRQVSKFFDLPVEPVLKTLCGRNEQRVRAAAEHLGWQGYATDYRQVLEDPEIDIVDIATPGSSHCEIAVAAAKAGKHVFCEKPIGNTLDEARRMLEAVRAAGVKHAVFHNYRKAPAVALIKRMIEEGRLGTIFHWRAVYLQDWIIDPNFPLVWRLDKEVAGSGSHGDLGAHLIDLARHLVGEIEEVSGLMHTFVKKRPRSAGADGKLGAAGAVEGELADVTVDDASLFLARFRNGALGTFEATRFAQGRKNHNKFEINGSKGSVVWCMERMNELEFYDATEPEGLQGFRVIQATENSHPYMEGYWPVGHIIGYEHTFINLVADALRAIAEDRNPSPDFVDGYENQRVLDAVERSHESKSWVSL
ncbi:MAG: Gfo/Idh/MocA family oxidoreductase [Fimbriimonadales bacterium]|nr:Gfo/Idh/MocA family oxidoreductase [Fimbriimonadales bacterium]